MKKAEGRMKKAEGKSPTRCDGATARREPAVRGPKHQGATRRPASSFILHPSSFTTIPVWLLAVLLMLVTVALYWPVTRCDLLVLDDTNLSPQFIKGLSWESLKWAFLYPLDTLWTPLTALSHIMACQAFGLWPFGHHLINVLLHALNAALVFVWLQQMTGATWRSLLVAALFAVHPLRVEPVAWVTERREVLCACFGLLALIAYVRYAQGRMQNPATPNTQHATRNTQHVSRFYLLSLLFLAFGLMSKPTIVTWPFVLLLLDYWPLGRMQNAAASDTQYATRLTPHLSRTTLLPLLVEKIPFFVLTALSSTLLMVIQRLGHLLEWGRDNPLGARLGNAVISYGWYLGKLLWPADLALFYPHPGYWPLGKVLLAGGLLLGLSALVCVGWRRHPYLLVGWLWYCGTLVPMSQVVQTGMLARADRWTYVSSLGVLILIVWGVCELTRRWRYQVLGLSLAGGTVLVLCLALTRYQIGYWKDEETLLRHSLAVTGNNEFPLAFLGEALDKKGQSDEAIRQYQAALRLRPDNFIVRNNLGIALGRRGQIDEALTQFQEAVRLAPADASCHYNLGNALLEKGQTDEAITQYRQAIRLNMYSVGLHNNLGLALARKGQNDEAITHYQEALRLEPADPDIHYNLGVALAQRGQINEAIGHYQEALRLNPDRAEAHNNLGTAFRQQGRNDEAIRQFQEALRLKPDFADARKNLILALGARGSPAPPPGAATNR